MSLEDTNTDIPADSSLSVEETADLVYSRLVNESEASDDADATRESDGAATAGDDDTAGDGVLPTGDGEPDKTASHEATDNPKEPADDQLLLHADYTRKTQQLALKEKQLAAEIEARKQELESSYREKLTRAEQVLRSSEPEILRQAREIDWTKLATEDPAEYVRLSAAVQKAQYEHQQLMSDAQARRQAVLQEQIEVNQKKLLENIPEWRDDSVRSAELGQIESYLKKVGFSDEIINTTVDHRSVEIARKAMLYDKLMNAKQSVGDKKVAPKPIKVAKPGTGTVKPQTGPKNPSLLKHAKATGRNDDIVAAVLANLDFDD